MNYAPASLDSKKAFISAIKPLYLDAGTAEEFNNSLIQLSKTNQFNFEDFTYDKDEVLSAIFGENAHLSPKVYPFQLTMVNHLCNAVTWTPNELWYLSEYDIIKHFKLKEDANTSILTGDKSHYSYADTYSNFLVALIEQIYLTKMQPKDIHSFEESFIISELKDCIANFKNTTSKIDYQYSQSICILLLQRCLFDIVDLFLNISHPKLLSDHRLGRLALEQGNNSAIEWYLNKYSDTNTRLQFKKTRYDGDTASNVHMTFLEYAQTHPDISESTIARIKSIDETFLLKSSVTLDHSCKQKASTL